MHLVQLLLPVTRADGGGPDHSAVYRALREELTNRFGGMTAYTRAPAEGMWQPDGSDGDAERDDVVMLEVVTPVLEHAWWIALRQRLERELGEDVIHVRALPMELL